ncbi:MAG: hypothetical protein WBA45_12930 [Microthrixaceae bacterium]
METGDSDVLRPELLAAMLALGLLKGRIAESIPMSAAWWIVEGIDSVEVTRLAGLSGTDTYEVRDVLRSALDAMGIEIPSSAVAVPVVFDELARRYLAGLSNERSVVSDVEQIYIDSGYLDEVSNQPLGKTYGLDDEWGAGWGRTDTEIIAEVKALCEEQIRYGEPNQTQTREL